MSNAKLPAPTDECAECGKHHSEHPEPYFWCDPADSDDFRVFTPKPLQVEGRCPLCKHNLFEGRCVNPNCPYDQRQLAPKAGAEATGKSDEQVFIRSEAVEQYKERLKERVSAGIVEVMPETSHPDNGDWMDAYRTWFLKLIDEL